MIAFLQGRLAGMSADSVVIDVGGVGFRVFVPGPLVSQLGPEGTTVHLFTHLLVRENEFALYGAADRATLDLFQLLLTVNGVGPRLALAMLTTWPTPTLIQAIVTEDLATLTHVPGVGRKTAQRVVLDLKTRLEALSPLPPGVEGLTSALTAEDGDALAALTALGYSTAEARRALATADLDPDVSVEVRIFAALRQLGGG
jgi:Holliday junction DNA helicase RuvA